MKPERRADLRMSIAEYLTRRAGISPIIVIELLDALDAMEADLKLLRDPARATWAERRLDEAIIQRDALERRVAELERENERLRNKKCVHALAREWLEGEGDGNTRTRQETCTQCGLPHWYPNCTEHCECNDGFHRRT